MEREDVFSLVKKNVVKTATIQEIDCIVDKFFSGLCSEVDYLNSLHRENDRKKIDSEYYAAKDGVKLL